MGQKVHPLGFRLGFTQKHQSHWYAKKAVYPLFVLEDRFIRNYFQTHFAETGIVKIEISRRVNLVHVELSVGRPKALVGSGGQQLKDVQMKLLQTLQEYRLNAWTKEQRIAQRKPRITLHVLTVENISSSASLLADDLADQLEKRIPFRRAMKTVLQRAERDNVPGIKIQVSGRLNGAEIARTEWIRKGRVPLQTLNAKVDYRARTATTIYGLLGIKIWLYQGMKDEISAQALLQKAEMTPKAPKASTSLKDRKSPPTSVGRPSELDKGEKLPKAFGESPATNIAEKPPKKDILRQMPQSSSVVEEKIQSPTPPKPPKKAAQEGSDFGGPLPPTRQ